MKEKNIKEGKLMIVGPDLMTVLFIKSCLLEFLVFVCYTQIIRNEVIFKKLQLIPKVVAKMLTTIKGKQARNWYSKVYLYNKENLKEQYDKNISNFINPIKRINWLNRIIEIQKLVKIYKIRSLKIRKLIQIISNETINLNTMEMRWSIPPEWVCSNSILIIYNVKKIINEYIYKNMSHVLNNDIENIDNKYMKLNDGYISAKLRKINNEYSITIKHAYLHNYKKYNREENKLVDKKFPTEEYYKYVFHKDEIHTTFFNKANKSHFKKIFKLNNVNKKGITLWEIKNPYLKYFCNLFIKAFKLVGIDIPYEKEFINLEKYFRYPYILNSIYELRDFLDNKININNIDNSDPSIMKMIWNKLNIPKSIRTKEAKIIKMYLMMERIDICNRLKYINTFYPKIEEINKKHHINISYDDIAMLLNILFIYKKNLLNNLDRIINFLINDTHFKDTLHMLRICVEKYPEEVTGYLNRFKLEELHDQLVIELAKMKDKEIEIPYKYKNIFKDQKIFDLNDGYEIHIPVCKKDLIILGNELSICVGSSSYYSDMIKNNNGYIFMMYYKGKPYGCIQWENNEISQAVLKYNNQMQNSDKIAYSKLVEFTQKYAKNIHINSPKKLW